MSYIYDKDLEFLKKCRNDELEGLFQILAFDPKNGKKRLTTSLLKSEEYKKYGDDYTKYWQTIAGELQLYGGNTIVNIIRGNKGVSYRQILEHVAGRLKLPLIGFIPTPELENAICEKLMLDVFSKMKEKDKEAFLKELVDEDENLKEIINSYNEIPWGKISVTVIRQVFKAGGMVTYRATLIFANMIWRQLFGRGLTFVANNTIARILGGFLSGPVAIALNAWIIADLTGPALRVLIPAVVLISALRLKYEIDNDVYDDSDDDFDDADDDLED